MSIAISGATFSQALNLVKDGYPIRRQSWGEDTYVTFIKGTVSSTVTENFVNAVPRSLFEVADGKTSMPVFVMTNSADNRNDCWTPQSIDLLAVDWVALDQPNADGGSV
ncbi:Thoeris anti-defense Tad2 family protein [Allorhizobium borbori]|uniref:Thoeris anti-defense 2-like domain-containing protein n=1 Tax=Allorhizobium borbori TaxID=485907 RepID=A0A7W6K6F1_9HYPH|nr:MW1434 family type I TA system toxin [Allorhizobium borbori]MBB4105972.1 hypothetical protein [Allorhizobium borbori]